MNSTSFLNKAEIQLYSTLISIISGINRLKTPVEPLPQVPPHEKLELNRSMSEVEVSFPKKAVSLNWEIIQQILLSFLLWTILGFAAGFLIGMLGPG